MDRIPRHTGDAPVSVPHNLGLYRLGQFSGRHRGLHRLQSWLLDSEAPPVLGLVGPAGVGKSTLATAAAWSTIRHFADGVVWVGPAGVGRFRVYDVVHSLDQVLGTSLTRRSQDLWQTGILEMVHGRSRLLVLDELEKASADTWERLHGTFLRFRTRPAPARVLLISQETTPVLRELAADHILALDGLTRRETGQFLAAFRLTGLDPGQAHALTGGNPLALRLLGGILAREPARLSEVQAASEGGRIPSLTYLLRLALRLCARRHPDAYDLLLRLMSAAGGASYTAVRDLFWKGERSAAAAPAAGRDRALVSHFSTLPPALRKIIQALRDHALLEQEPDQARVVIHPVVRDLLATGTAVRSPEWTAAHARYYLRFATQYERLDLDHWSEVDAEWGNIRQGAEWCARLIREASGRAPRTLAAELAGDAGVPDPPAVPSSQLALVRRYTKAMALHTFWRHPPGGLEWIAAGAVACACQADFHGFGHLLLQLGRQFFFRRDFPESLRWLERARKVFEYRGLVTQLAYVHADIGMVRRELAQPAAALRHCQISFEYLAQGGDLTELAGAYLNLGSLHQSLHQHSQALHQYRQGLSLAIRLDDRRHMASGFNNVGLVLEAMSQPDAAEAVYHRALELYRYLELAEGESMALANLGSLAYLRGDMSGAARFHRQALACCARREAWLDMAATHHNLGLALRRAERWTEAAREFEASRDLYRAFQLDAYAAEEETLRHQCQAAGAAA